MCGLAPRGRAGEYTVDEALHDMEQAALTKGRTVRVAASGV